MNITLFLSGYRWLGADAGERDALINLCFRLGIGYDRFVCCDDGSVRFRTSACAAARLASACKTEGISLCEHQKGGLWHLFYRYRRRAGVFVGATLALLSILLSTRFIWAIEVTGNETVDTAEILEELDACGFGIGSYIPHLSTERLETEVLIASDRIAWIAIRVDGTHATVQVIERKEAPPAEDHTAPANLVAARDGQIEQLLLYRGNCVVSIGQAVRKGELLVSGLYDSQVYPYRYTRASGEILARTQLELRVEIPLFHTQKSYDGERVKSVSLKILGFSLKIFKNSRNEEGSCDIIKEDHNLSLPFVSDLPFSCEVVKRKAYTESDATRTADEALELAYEELARSLSAFSEEAQLIGKQIETEWQDGVLILRCTVTCIENIAVQSEFEISEHP